MPDLDLELLPADDEGLSPEAERAAAIAGAVAEPDASLPEAEPAPLPFGKTWVFDFDTGQFVRPSGTPSETSGFGALEQWVLMVAHSARYAHRVFSDQFGMEDPEGNIGEFGGPAAVAEYEQHLREAVLVHERITGLQNFKGTFDPATGELVIERFDIVTDEEEVLPIVGVTLDRAGVLV